MLESISVKNLALIKECKVNLQDGLNILTGETGAGKSLILGSIRLALGERSGKDVIRTGEEYALVELVFTDNRKEVTDCMRALDLPIESDGSIYISRRIMEGRSVAKCNGETISARDLKKLAGLLIDIHGQNDTRELLDAANYRDILDDTADESLHALKEEMALRYASYKKLKSELDSAAKDDRDKEKDIALASFEADEIDNARLVPGEDEELEERYRVMKNNGRIAESMSRATAALDSEGAASSLVGASLRELSGVIQYDTRVSKISDRLAAVEGMLSEVARDISSYMDDMEFSESEYREVESRLDVLNHLKNKYGDSIEAVLSYGQDRREYLLRMENIDAYMESLRADTDRKLAEALEIADKLHGLRCSAAKELCGKLRERLSALSFDNVSLDISVKDDKDKLSASGYDDVDILVSFNLGEPVKALNQVASGGELSRFMLALKEVTAANEGVSTLVFDEIDAGISGKTAWNVSGSLKKLAKVHQVIAITHLPQIAARADAHYLIEKHAETDSTITDIVRLDDEERTAEIARLLSGGEVTEAGLINARELIENN